MTSFATFNRVASSPSSVRSTSVSSTSKPSAVVSSGTWTRKRRVSRTSSVTIRGPNATPTPALSMRQHLQGAHGCSAQLRTVRKATTKSAGDGSLTVRCGPYPPVDEGNIHHVYSEQDFNRAIEAAGDKLVVVDICRRYCGPCTFIYPTFRQLSEEMPNVTFLRLLGDYNEDTKVLSSKLKIGATPNFQFYHKKNKIFSFLGANPTKFKTHLDRLTAKVDPEMRKAEENQLPLRFAQVPSQFDAKPNADSMCA